MLPRFSVPGGGRGSRLCTTMLPMLSVPGSAWDHAKQPAANPVPCLQHEHLQAWPRLQQRVCRRQPCEAGADDCDVTRRHSTSVRLRCSDPWRVHGWRVRAWQPPDWKLCDW
eukprot:364806-Chlamydomonas_euryale.AAC.13